MVEGLVIVLSILLALWADAWWTDVQERAEESALLRLLEAEFEQNLTLLSNSTRFHQLYNGAARQLLDIEAGRAPMPTELVLDSLVAYAMLTANSFNASSGAFQTFDGTNARLIGPELRTRLAEWPGLLEDSREDEVRLVELVDQQFKPYLLSELSYANAFAASGETYRQAYGSFERETAAEDFRALLARQEFRNHLVNRAALEGIVLREHQKLRTAGEDILQLIREALADS